MVYALIRYPGAAPSPARLDLVREFQAVLCGFEDICTVNFYAAILDPPPIMKRLAAKKRHEAARAEPAAQPIGSDLFRNKCQAGF